MKTFNADKIFSSAGVILLITSFLFFLSARPVPAQTNPVREIYLLDRNDAEPYVEFISSDIKDLFHPESSGKYPSVHLFDGFFRTCWVAGNAQTGKTSSLYVKVPEDIDPGEVILNIFAGYGKSVPLYRSNARPQQIKVSLFAGFYPDGFSTEVSSLYLIKEFSSDTFQLADTFGVQSFPLHLDTAAFSAFLRQTKEECSHFSGRNYNSKMFSQSPQLLPALILELEILKSRPGTKYGDVCVSEIFFNDRFVTAYPAMYEQIEDVSIENDNTVLVDYKDRKKVTILKDTSMVYMIDHPEGANWAVLHYVPNSSVGAGSRVEERYSLLDLKNKKIVDKELKKCTGQTPFLIEKTEDGKVLLTTFDDRYKIELK